MFLEKYNTMSFMAVHLNFSFSKSPCKEKYLVLLFFLWSQDRLLVVLHVLLRLSCKKNIFQTLCFLAVSGIIMNLLSVKYTEVYLCSSVLEKWC